MKSALLNFVVAVLLVIPGVAQMRSTISAGPMHAPGTFNGSRPHPPGVFFRNGFDRHFHGNRFGTFIYPVGFYDGFYDDSYNGYPEAPEQPTPPVVVIRDAPAAPPAAVQAVPAEPKMIEVAEPVAVTSKPGKTPVVLTKTPAAVFILSDGRRLESQNYTITDSVLTIKEPYRSAVQVPLSQLNIDATLAENHQRGLDLRLPESRSEILLGF